MEYKYRILELEFAGRQMWVEKLTVLEFRIWDLKTHKSINMLINDNQAKQLYDLIGEHLEYKRSLGPLAGKTNDD